IATVGFFRDFKDKLIVHLVVHQVPAGQRLSRKYSAATRGSFLTFLGFTAATCVPPRRRRQTVSIARAARSAIPTCLSLLLSDACPEIRFDRHDAHNARSAGCGPASLRQSSESPSTANACFRPCASR